ncbi:MAG: 6-bladed beta-propeller [Bacteroidetes bacterium]|jgi:hypothetical protein|nr:6-bladed beta-propeller [Bacteroidota bacterium]
MWRFLQYSAAGLYVAVGLFLFPSCTWEQEASSSSGPDTPPDIGVHVEEHVVLGLTANDVLARPVDVAMDSEGLIYVLDRDVPAIRVFTGNGAPVTTIGTRGEGPGEFSRPHALLDEQDRILVADRGAFRIHGLNVAGEVTNTWSTANAGALWVMPSDFQPTSNEHFLVLGTPFVFPDDDRPSELLYFISLSSDSLHVHDRLLSESIVLGESSAGFDPVIGTDGSFLQTSTKYVLYSPFLYDGELFVMQQNAQGDWQRAEPWNGYVETERAYEALDPTTVETSADFPSTWSSSRREDGEFVDRAGRAHNTSHGLHELPDGTIAHFTQIRVDDHRTLGVELFSKEGNFEGYAPLPELASETLFGLSVQQLGNSQRFSITTTKDDGTPIVRVVSIDFED